MKKIILVLVGLCCPLFSFGSNPVGFDCAAKNGTFMISFLKGNLGDKEYKLGILVGHKIENRKFEDSFVYPISTSDFEAFQKTKSLVFGPTSANGNPKGYFKRIALKIDDTQGKLQGFTADDKKGLAGEPTLNLDMKCNWPGKK